MFSRPPPELSLALLPLTVQLVSVAVPRLYRPPPPGAGGVAADGAVGQRERAVEIAQAAAVGAAELPLTVQSVSVRRAAEIVQAAAAVAGGVAADGAVGQRDRPPDVGQATAAAIGGRVAAGDRQSRDRRGDTARRPGTPGSARRR